MESQNKRIPIQISWEKIPGSKCFVCEDTIDDVAVLEVGINKLTFDHNCLLQFSNILYESVPEKTPKFEEAYRN